MHGFVHKSRRIDIAGIDSARLLGKLLLLHRCKTRKLFLGGYRLLVGVKGSATRGTAAGGAGVAPAIWLQPSGFTCTRV